MERLLHEACVKTKEAYTLKKMGGAELPEHLQGSNLPVEAIALEKDLLIMVAKRMGVILTHTLAHEAILTATKPSPTDHRDETENRKSKGTGNQEPDAQAKLLLEQKKIMTQSRRLVKWRIFQCTKEPPTVPRFCSLFP